VLVRAVIAVIISVTDPHAADAATVATRELVAMARPVGMSADSGQFVTPVSAVVFAVTVPPRRDASVRRLAAKIICTTYSTLIRKVGRYTGADSGF